MYSYLYIVFYLYYYIIEYTNYILIQFLINIHRNCLEGQVSYLNYTSS